MLVISRGAIIAIGSGIDSVAWVDVNHEFYLIGVSIGTGRSTEREEKRGSFRLRDDAFEERSVELRRNVCSIVREID